MCPGSSVIYGAKSGRVITSCSSSIAVDWTEQFSVFFLLASSTYLLLPEEALLVWLPAQGSPCVDVEKV